jgi:hypothetical protein
MAKQSLPVILATPLAYPKASKALSNVALAAKSKPDFYNTIEQTYKTNGKNATVGDLPKTLQSAVIAHWE